MAMTTNDVVALAADTLIPAWSTERKKLDRIDRWARWSHDAPHKPRTATREYKELSDRAQAPWGALIVTSVAQTLYVEGYRRPDDPEDATGWEIWQANAFDARQLAIHQAVLTYGQTYAFSLPGKLELTGEPMPTMRGVSPREMIALYDDPAIDEWPEVALRARPKGDGHRLSVFDDEKVHTLHLGSKTDKPVYAGEEVHDTGVCPVVRYVNRFDLEGRAAGEIEPFIPLLGRIDQTVFDRLVVQRFASWVVRTISGMDVSKSADEAGITVPQAMMKLKIEDLLVGSEGTQFGSLPATPLDGFIRGEERDLTDLAAVSQTPAFELLGQMSNMSAESLAAAKASQTAKGNQVQHSIGESHEQLIRLGEHQLGNEDGAKDFMAQVRWADTSIRSIAQAVDAYGKMTQMLGYPPELLWSKIPGLTKQDVDEATKKLAESGGIDAFMKHLVAGNEPAAAG